MRLRGIRRSFAKCPFLLQPILGLCSVDNDRFKFVEGRHALPEPIPYRRGVSFNCFCELFDRVGLAGSDAPEVRLALLAGLHFGNPYSEVERKRFEAIQVSISSGR